MKYSFRAKATAFTLLFCNFFDCIDTLYLYQKTYIEETNPLMKFLLDNCPLGFVFYKIVLISAGVLWVTHYFDESKIARVTFTALTVVYVFVVLYQFSGLAYLAYNGALFVW